MRIKMCSRCKKRPAMVYITRIEGDKTIPEGLCLSCAKELGIKPINDMLKNMGIPEEDYNAMQDQFMELMNVDQPDSGEEGEEGDFEPGGATTFPFLKEIFGEEAEQNPPTEKTASPQKEEKEKGKRHKKRKYLDTYCADLTERAKNGQIDRIVGRDKELYRVVQILSRRTKNNPCLIGEPGVGKTAIAEGLALKIAAGDVPSKLMDKELHLLDLTALVAGTQFRGQFESRVKGLVEEVKSEGNIILFIDEVHNLVGTGDAEGSMNAANILKPALSRGEIQVIGATTFNEYRRHIEKDAALERRFQPVTVEEPSIDNTVVVLKGIREYYEKHHNVKVDDRILYQTAVLSERYINDRFLPDKAIDLLDESCACASLRNKAADDLFKLEKSVRELKGQEEELESHPEQVDYERLALVKSDLAKNEARAKDLRETIQENRVTFDDLAKVIELWTGIPASKVQESDLKKLANLEEKIKERVIGQDEAVSLVSAAVRRSRVQISPKRRPASFIFVGPTGVGKTELVKVLANELFSTPETLIRLDMSEFMEKHSVSRIIGAPPGYVGYDEAGQLTEKVRRKPYSVILFDEIEKAHPDVLNVLLQILDDGRVTDAHGRTVNFENTIIVMTSNAGSERKEGALGFGKTEGEASYEKSMKALREFLRPEFISRVDEVVVFKPLSMESYEKIAELFLKELTGPLQDKGIALTYDPAVPKKLCEGMEQSLRGARDLRNAVRRRIEDPITNLLVQECDRNVTAVRIGADLAVTAQVDSHS